MKNQIIPFFIYLSIVLSMLWIKFPFSNLIIIVSTVFFYGFLMYKSIEMSKKEISGEFVLRKKTKKIHPIFLVFAVIATIGYTTKGERFLLQTVLSWSIVIFDLATTIITTKLKPITLAIRENQIIVNNWSPSSRDLSQLSSVKLNVLFGSIEMKFETENSLTLFRREYEPSDLDQLISICKEKSQKELYISENLLSN